MSALLICIACNVGIFLCFRAFQQFRINTFQAITFNYWTCVLIGTLFVGPTAVSDVLVIDNPWLWPAVILGIIFIGTFYLMARTTQIYSMTVASIASKMSLIIPVLISLLFLGARVKEYTWLNYLGIALAIVAIVFSSLRKGDKSQHDVSGYWYMPLLVFLFGGVIDTSMNYLNLNLVSPQEAGILPIVIFLIAGLIGAIVLMSKRAAISSKAVLGGFALGTINYFSLYFLLKGLSDFQNDGAFFFPILNIGIILGSAIVSVLLFREKLMPMNIAGIILSVIAIVMLSYQEILALI